MSIGRVIMLTALALAVSSIASLATASEELASVRQRLDFAVYQGRLTKCSEPVLELSNLYSDNSRAKGKAWENGPEAAALMTDITAALKTAADCTKVAAHDLNASLKAYTSDEIRNDLFMRGFAVVAKTSVDGEYSGGCGVLGIGILTLSDGDIFVCDKSSPMLNYSVSPPTRNPEILILKNVTTGETVLLAGGIAYGGRILRKNY